MFLFYYESFIKSNLIEKSTHMSDDKFSKDKTVERHSNLNARTKKIATYKF